MIEERSLADSFQRELSRVGGKTAIVGDLNAAFRYIADSAREKGAKLLVRADLGVPVGEAVDRFLESEGFRIVEASTSTLDLVKQAEVGLSWADIGIAATGTIGIVFQGNMDLAATALPYMHIALLPRERIVPGLADVEGFLKRNSVQGERRIISLITGPSRTADIEQFLIKGVHGPNDLRVIVIGGEEG